MDEGKIYHYPDWDRAEKGTSLTDWAICGQLVRNNHWFPMGASVVTCVKCIEIRGKDS